MGKRLISMIACLLLIAVQTMAEDRVITGTVYDSETGETLVGASIKITGTTKGTVTDANGNFSLKNVHDGAKTLSITYMGMKPMTVQIKEHMKIHMEPSYKTLNETMVVAYGSATRQKFTGSASVVDQDIIANRTISNVTNALNGTAAGVQIAGTNGDPDDNAPSIRIRGIGSMSASNEPLYVVDGVPYDGPISAINSQDVESMTVLKDAAASAIYGARGANGVVLITTKKGRNQSADIRFDAKWGSNSRLIPQYDVIKNPGQYYETYFKRMYNNYVQSGLSDAEAYKQANANIYNSANEGIGYQIFTVPDGENLIGTNFRLNPNAKMGYSDGQYTYQADDWYNETFHNSFRQEYNLSVSGVGDRLNYYASLGYLDDGGIVANSGVKRYNGRVNVEYQAKDWLKFNTNMNYTHKSSETPSYDADNWGSSGNVFYVCNTIAPVYPLYVRDADGNIIKDSRTGLATYDANQTNYNRAGIIGNAVRDNLLDKTTNNRDIFTGNWGLTATPVKGLSLIANIGVMYDAYRYSTLYSIFGSSSGTDGDIYVNSTRNFSFNQQYMAKYKTDFGGSRHNLEALIGYEQYKLTEQVLYGENDHLFDPFIAELNQAGGVSKKVAQSKTERYMTQGIFAQLQYDYAGKYFGGASYRRDASSRFAPGHRWGDFGSVSFAWMMNKEKFLENAKWIDMLKFKMSYGVQGNDRLLTSSGDETYYPYADLYQTSYDESTGKYSTSLSQKGNPDLTWETSHNFNIGFDYSFFGDRLKGSVEYFLRKTTDLLYYKDTPLSSGVSTGYYPTNIGSILNHGIEFDINGTIIRNKNLQWDAYINFTHYTNKILSLDPSIPESGYVIGGRKIWKEGGSIYEAYMIKYAGVDPTNGNALYYKTEDDGTITTTSTVDDATLYDCGSTLPKLYGGFGTSLHWKGFDFSIGLSFQLGGKIYDSEYQALMWTQDNFAQNIHKDLLNAWTSTNTNTNIPRWDRYGWGSLAQTNCDFFLTSSNYLSLNNITLGYTFPTQLIKKTNFINSLRVYVSGDNLAVASARQGLDPRYSTGNVASYSGVSGHASGSSYSSMRTITGGVTVTF